MTSLLFPCHFVGSSACLYIPIPYLLKHLRLIFHNQVSVTDDTLKNFTLRVEELNFGGEQLVETYLHARPVLPRPK